jgi:hypothetical protein
VGPISPFVRLLLPSAGFVILVILMVWLVRYAKRGSRGAHALGAAFLLLGFGNVKDPTDEIAQQAQRYKLRDQDESGEPPNPDCC